MTSLVLTIGTFDLLHYGHIGFLHQCSMLGTDLLVGVNTTEFVTTFKRTTVMSDLERQFSLEQLGYRTVLNRSSGRELIETHRPDVLAVGSDWARKNYHSQIGVDQDYLDSRRVTVAYIPYVQTYPISTTEIIRRIREQTP